MKRFLIKYRFSAGTRDDWHAEIARFIAALSTDPALKGRISYRCMRARDSDDYYHLASTADDTAAKELQQRDFFKHYTEATKRVSGGTVEVLPLDVIAETA
jgi:hypothetical protein